MKKSIFLMAGVLGLMFTACEDTSDLGTMQVNQAPALVESNGVSSNFLLGSSLDLNTWENKDLPVLAVQMKTDFPESSNVGGVMQVSKNADFSNAHEIALFSSNSEQVENGVRKYNVQLEANQWENAFVSDFGKAPFAEDMYVRYMIYVQDGTQKLILPYQGEDWWPAYTLNVTPVDLKYDIADAYVVNGQYFPTDGLAMIHSDEHKYDDPMFTALFSVSEEQAAAGFTWTISPVGEPNVVYGVAAGSETVKTGRLVEGGVPAQITQAGPYKIEVNMQTKMYNISAAIDAFYVPCTGNNISFTRNCQKVYTTDFQTYSGACYIDKYFGFFSSPTLKGTNYLKGDKEGTVQVSTSTLSADTGLGSLSAGLYWVSFNTISLTYSTEHIKTLSLIGAFNNWEEDLNLKTSTSTSATKYTIWTGTVTFPAAGSEFKIRSNGTWDEGNPNFGGSLDDLRYNDGTNLKAPDAGTYKVTVNFQNYPYTITLEKQ